MKILSKWLPVGLVIGIGLWSVWPMVKNRQLISNIGSDAWLITWIMHQPLLSFQGNAFYPYKNVLAYSDMFKLSKIAAGGSFAQAIVIGQVATMLIVYGWWVHLAKASRTGAAIGAVALGLSQIRWEYQVHLQMWGMQYWLVGLGLVGSWFSDKRMWKLYLGTVILGMQMYESPLPVYFAAVVMVVWIIFNQFSKIQIFKKALIPAVFFSIIIFPAVRVYGGVAREFGFRREIREAAHNSIGIDDLWGRFWSPGLAVLLLVSLHTSPYPSPKIGEGIKGRGIQTKWLLFIIIFGLVMAMGPVVKWQGKTVKVFGQAIPLPYAVAYYVVPGWQGFRTPSRWLWLSAFAASGIIAQGFKNAKGKGLLAPLLVAIIGGTKLTNVMALPKEVPNVYKWLKDQPGKVVLELPAYTWPREQIEVERMYYSLYHGKTLVNGFSGFTPPLEYKLAVDPIGNVLEEVDYIVVHDKSYTYPGKILYKDEENIVYSGI